MPKEPLKMNQIKAILTRKEDGQSVRTIATSLGLSRSRVQDNITRAKAAKLTSENVPDDPDELQQLLFGNRLGSTRALPDFARIAVELRKPNVTLALLHEEYFAEHPDGLRYSHFCDRFRRYRKQVDVTMRQTHLAGDKLFLDFAGGTVPVIEIGHAHIFVAVLGASNYTFACATPDETTQSWISGTTQAFAFIRGVPRAAVPDNPKATVTKPCRYEPVINRAFAEMAEHYHTAILPARVGKPKDKAKAEGGVLLVKRWILARLRNRTFMTVGELNDAIKPLLERLNDRPFKKLPGTRRELFESLDRPALKPLPVRPYEYACWASARVGKDYHVQLHVGDRRYHLYSVPYRLCGRRLDLRLTARVVEIFDRGALVATHRRRDTAGRSTLDAHMPDAHLAYQQIGAKSIRAKASKIGPSCRQIVDRIMADQRHIEQGFRQCQGILRLQQTYGHERLEAGCARAVYGDLPSFRSIESILKSGLDKQPLDDQPQLITNHPSHVRGSSYYLKQGDA